MCHKTCLTQYRPQSQHTARRNATINGAPLSCLALSVPAKALRSNQGRVDVHQTGCDTCPRTPQKLGDPSTSDQRRRDNADAASGNRRSHTYNADNNTSSSVTFAKMSLGSKPAVNILGWPSSFAASCMPSAHNSRCNRTPPSSPGRDRN